MLARARGLQVDGQSVTVAVEATAISGVLTSKLSRKRLTVPISEVEKIVVVAVDDLSSLEL